MHITVCDNNIDELSRISSLPEIYGSEREAYDFYTDYEGALLPDPNFYLRNICCYRVRGGIHRDI